MKKTLAAAALLLLTIVSAAAAVESVPAAFMKATKEQSALQDELRAALNKSGYLAYAVGVSDGQTIAVLVGPGLEEKVSALMTKSCQAHGAKPKKLDISRTLVTMPGVEVIGNSHYRCGESFEYTFITMKVTQGGATEAVPAVVLNSVMTVPALSKKK